MVDTLNALDTDIIEKIYMAIEKARTDGKQVFVLGNGGSAAAASHWVCDFGKGINRGDSKRLKIFSPGDSLSLLTALGNDVSYDEVYREQLKNYLNPGDLVISLSVSGNSPNLVKAHQYANEVGAQTIAVIGDYNGALGDCSTVVLTIPSKNYGVVEDIHMCIDHAISQYMASQNENQNKQ